MNALAKLASAEFSAPQILFFRMVVGLAPAAVFVALRGGRAQLRTASPTQHLARAVFGLSALGLFFHAFAVMPLADAVAISFSLPLFVAALSRPLLGEGLTGREFLPILLGFGGVLLIVRPGLGAVTGPALIALAASFLNALAHVTVRRLSRTDDSATIVFYFTLVGAALSAVPAATIWQTPSMSDLGILCAVGLCGGVGQCFMVAAYSRSRAGLVAPFEYTNLLWSAGFAFALWGERPDALTWVGAAVVAASTLYLVRVQERPRPSALV
jgi:drug/metabolite transporter (DMT)-like permease